MRKVCSPLLSSATVSLGLLLLVAFQSAGWLMAWQGMHWTARLEARRVMFSGNAMPEKTFSKSFFAQIKVDRKEIRLDGHLYDFRTLAESADSIRVALYHDQKEEALLSALGQLFQSGEDSGNASAQHLAKWLAQNLGASFLTPSSPMLPALLVFVFNKPMFSIEQVDAQCTPGIFAPPPEVV
jgi:hypothetical protein